MITRFTSSLFMLVILSLLAGPLLAQQGDTDFQPVPFDQVFRLQSAVIDENTIEVGWEIDPGYYLYRHRLGFISKTEGIELGEPLIPDGKQKTDEFFGDVETYYDALFVTIPLNRIQPATTELVLEVRSQGCKENGICYAPQRTFVNFSLPQASLAAEVTTPLTDNALQLGPSSNTLLGNNVSVFGDQPLPVHEAFKFEAIVDSSTRLLARWTIADGYYLYRDKLAFSTGEDAGAVVTAAELPAGEPMFDEHFGDVMVFFNQIEFPIELGRMTPDAGVLSLSVDFQGCKKDGICYPPESTQVSVVLPEYQGELYVASDTATASATSSSIDNAAPVSETTRLTGFLEDSNALLALAAFFMFGVLLTFTPCVFPTIPILAGIIVGEGKDVGTRRAFLLSLTYVSAMVLIYAVAGFATAKTGQNMQSLFQNVWVISGMIVILVLLSLSMFGFYEIQIPASWQARLNSISNSQKSGTYLGAFIMGGISTLIIGACVAPPLAAVIQYIAQKGDVGFGTTALAILALGQGTPLLIMGATGGKLLPRAGVWMNTVKAVFGVMLLALAIWMLDRIAPPAVVLALWGALFITSGVAMGALEPLAEAASGFRRFAKGIGVILLALGVIELIGAASGSNDWLRPLKGMGGGSASAIASTEQQSFRKIKSLQDLNTLLAETDKPVMLDFYADWCVDCKRMDRYTFPEPVVQRALADGVAVKADVTDVDDLDTELMKAFGVIGPPAILFFDRNGNELATARLFGFKRAEPFAEHVTAAFRAGQ